MILLYFSLYSSKNPGFNAFALLSRYQAVLQAAEKLFCKISFHFMLWCMTEKNKKESVLFPILIWSFNYINAW